MGDDGSRVSVACRIVSGLGAAAAAAAADYDDGDATVDEVGSEAAFGSGGFLLEHYGLDGPLSEYGKGGGEGDLVGEDEGSRASRGSQLSQHAAAVRHFYEIVINKIQ